MNCTIEFTAGLGVEAVNEAVGAELAVTAARMEIPRTAIALKKLGKGLMEGPLGWTKNSLRGSREPRW